MVDDDLSLCFHFAGKCACSIAHLEGVSEFHWEGVVAASYLTVYGLSLPTLSRRSTFDFICSSAFKEYCVTYPLLGCFSWKHRSSELQP